MAGITSFKRLQDTINMNGKTPNGTSDGMEKNESRMASPSQKRTCLERVLILALSVALLTVILLAILLAVALRPEESDICLTKECTAIAARVTSFIDYDIDPCSDFYDFACGSWMKKTVIPEDSPGVFVYGDLNNEIRLIVKNLLESTKDDDIEAVRKSKSFYHACMNESYIEQLNASEFLNFIEALGGWPTLGDKKGGGWNESDFDFMSDLISLRVYKMSPFIDIRVGVDKKKSSRRIIQIGEPVFSMPSQNYYYDDKYTNLRQAVVEFAKNVAVLLGADPAVAESDVMELFSLERKLSNRASLRSRGSWHCGCVANSAVGAVVMDSSLRDRFSSFILC